MQCANTCMAIPMLSADSFDHGEDHTRSATAVGSGRAMMKQYIHCAAASASRFSAHTSGPRAGNNSQVP